MFRLTVDIPFSAAHQIRGHPGPCAHLHGHNYRAAVTVAGDQLNDHGMLIDFGELKALCADVVEPLDHSYLNDLPPFADANPTAEVIARHIHRQVTNKLAGRPGSKLRVTSVTVYESERSSAVYEE